MHNTAPHDIFAICNTMTSMSNKFSLLQCKQTKYGRESVSRSQCCDENFD